MERGAFQRAVHLHDECERLCAAVTPRPRGGNGRQGVLRSGTEAQTPGTHSAPSRGTPFPPAPPRPPPRLRSCTHRDATQLASCPGGGPLGTVLHRRIPKSQEHRLPDGRHNNWAPTCQRELRWLIGSVICARAPRAPPPTPPRRCPGRRPPVLLLRSCDWIYKKV